MSAASRHTSTSSKRSGTPSSGWLTDVTLAASHGFRSVELADLRRLVLEHRVLFQEKWDEHFSRSH